jgi:hypothetical protein
MKCYEGIFPHEDCKAKPSTPSAPQAAKPVQLERNMSTPESREYWDFVEKTAAKVREWPEWKRRQVSLVITPEHSPAPRTERDELVEAASDEQYRGREVKTFECKRCNGKGIYFDHSGDVLAPYQPIGFSRKRMEQARRDYERAKRACEVCDGRGIIIEPK